MPFPRYPDVNGVRTSYCSIEFAVNSFRIPGAKSINYKFTHERGRIRGTSANVIGRTRPNEDAEGDIELYQAEWNALLPFLTLGGTIGFAESSNLITVTYAELASPEQTVTDILEGVSLHSPEMSNTEGTDATVVKVSLDIFKLRMNTIYEGVRSPPPSF